MYTSRIDKFVRKFADIQFSFERYFNMSLGDRKKIEEASENFVKKHRTTKNKKKFDRMINHLTKKGLIVKKEVGDKKMIFITQKGMNRALLFSIKTVKKEKRKDGKLVLLVFDIPEKSRYIRHLLRSVLKNLGYKMVQQSVWVSSYDVIGETKRFLNSYSLSSYVKIFLCDNIK